MRLSVVAYALPLAAMFALGTAQDNVNATELIGEMQAELPSCAFNCIVQGVLASSCAISNFTCICTNIPLNEEIILCLQSNCTVLEQLQTENFQTDTCAAPVHNASRQVQAIIWSLFALATISVVLRLLSRIPYITNVSLYWDDWTILACLLGLAPCTVIAHMMVNYGLGRDIWNLSSEQISKVLFYFFVEENLYTFQVVFTKISIVLLYLRIFPSQPFRYSCFALIAVIFLFGVSCWVSTSLLCSPVSYNWTSWDGEHEGRCAGTNAQVYSMAGINMTLDLTVFFFPIPQLANLSMTVRKKVGIILMFLVGLFVTVCSAVRIQTLVQWGKSTNPTYDYTRLAVWSLVEVDVGVICACMPGMAALLRRIWPRIWGSMKDRSSYPSHGTPGLYNGRTAAWKGSHTTDASGSSGRFSNLGHNAIAKKVHVTVEYDDERPEGSARSDELELIERYGRSCNHFQKPGMGAYYEPESSDGEFKRMESRGTEASEAARSGGGSGVRFCNVLRKEES